MIWFALPIDIALMALKRKETGQELDCDVNSIPFIPDAAKARFKIKLRLKDQFCLFFQARIINSMKTKSASNKRTTSVHQKKVTPKRGSSTSRV